MTQETEIANKDRRIWFLFGGALLMIALPTAVLFYLSWNYVPHHTERFAELDVELPLSTKLAIVYANWFIRLLPFIIVLGVPFAGSLLLVLIILALTKVIPLYRTVKAVTITIVIFSIGEMVV